MNGLKKSNEDQPGLVSIVIPVYNAAPYIKKCIRSIQLQSYTKLEIIIIDDGSTDDSPLILNKLAKSDTRISLVHQKNAGVGSARNLGIDMAHGEYLTFVDADDYVRRDYVEGLVQRMCETDADMVICGACFVDEKGKVLQRLIPDRYERFTYEEWPMRISAVWSHFYRHSLWRNAAIRFAPGVRGEDLPIALYYAAQCSHIEILPECGYAYVQHEGSARHQMRGLKRMNLPYQALEEVIGRVMAEGIKNSPAYHELFALRILAVFLFDLGIGASPGKSKELFLYVRRIVKQYYPECRKNPLTVLSAPVDVPFLQKAAVWILTRIVCRG